MKDGEKTRQLKGLVRCEQRHRHSGEGEVWVAFVWGRGGGGKEKKVG